LRWGITHLQVIEEVLINEIIRTFQKHNIDTTSIREELKLFVNQGIYMTGGSLAVENLAIGRFAKIIHRRKVKQTQKGEIVLMKGGPAK
jgi:hypothetical protein